MSTERNDIKPLRHATPLPPYLDDERAGEHGALLHFAGRALKETRTEDIVGWDGGDLEEAMTESGLLELQSPTVPCHEGCRCQESYSAGEQAECYVFTDLAQRALKSLETSDPRSA